SQVTTDGAALVARAGDIRVDEITPGVVGVQEVQELILPSGVTKGTWAPAGTTAVAWNASTATIKAAIETDLGESISLVGGSGGDYFVTWYDEEPQAALTPVSISLSSQPTITIVETTHGDGTHHEVQTISFGGTPDGGTWTVNGGSGLAYNASTSAVQADLDATLGSGVV